MFYERAVTSAGTVPTVTGPSYVLVRGSGPAGGPPVRPRPGRIASDRAGQVGLQVVDLLLPWAVALATLVARLATAAAGPTDWDSSQYLAAVSHFDVTHGRPQPPGYWLYVVAGRLVHATGLGTVESLVLVAAVASAAGAGLTVVAGRDLGGRWVGLAAGLLVATSPFVWFDGSIVATYSFDLVIAPLLIILAWRARPHSWHGAGALVALAVAAGFRQSDGHDVPPARPAGRGRIGPPGARRASWPWPPAPWRRPPGSSPWSSPSPGGLTAWSRATRVESEGAVRASSVLDHAAGGAVEPRDVRGLHGGRPAAPGRPGRRGRRRARPPGGVPGYPPTPRRRRPGDRPGVRAGTRSGPRPVPALPGIDDAAPSTAGATGGPRHRRRPPPWDRPWYQARTPSWPLPPCRPWPWWRWCSSPRVGYLLAYLPGAVIALLLVPGGAPATPTR